MKTLNLTDADRAAFDRVVAKIAALRKDSEDRFPEYKSSEWQFAYTVASKGFLTINRINRLVSLGLLEQQPSDGHGPSIRVNPEHKRYL